MNSHLSRPPACWSRPSRLHRKQTSLFADIRDAALASLAVSEDELRRWHQSGWISDEAIATERMHDYLVEEIAFVRDVARSGLSDGQVSSLLLELGNGGYSYHGGSVAYSFRYGWVQTTGPERPEFVDFIRDSIEDDDEVSLNDLLKAQQLIQAAIDERQLDGDDDQE